MASDKISLSTPIEKFPLVGPAFKDRLKKLEIETVFDLLNHYPHRWQDFSLISPIGLVQAGEKVTVKGEILSISNLYTRSGKQLQKAIVADATGSCRVIWFNQPFLVKNLAPGTKVALSGKLQESLTKPALISPEYEILKTKQTIHTGRLVPVYPETASVSSKWLRSRIALALNLAGSLLIDWLPEKIKRKYRLIDLPTALNQIHFPLNLNWAKNAKERLAFDELLLLHLQTLNRRSSWQEKKIKVPLKINQAKIDQFISRLPFKLTKDQEKAVEEILKDLGKATPANRLLQGDVGSGKTVVAAIAIYACFLNQKKSAFMVPTELLAEQHLKTLEQLLAPYGVKIGFFTSSFKNKSGQEKIDLFLGTHALLHRKLNFKKVDLVIIDEQHRFGVEQRSTLINQSHCPHLLTMTATPIPRTIALTLYGDLDLSLIYQMPKGRKKVKTWVVGKQKREDAYDWVKKQVLKKGSQVFIVCPLIELSQKERMANVRAAAEEFEKLKKIFRGLNLSLLHGRVKAGQRQKIMRKLSQGRIDILVSTPVVEVGIDIPNATVMLIEAAERFGLSQLHQLRGRVGRGEKQAYCLLFSDLERPQNLRRLRAMENFRSGLKLAEMDLKIRGPGEIYGTAQSGFLNLKIASFTDSNLISRTRQAAEELYSRIGDYPLLKEKLKKITISRVKPN